MKIDRDTICCVSIAERPGNLGAAIFNAAFQELNLNYVYKPFCVFAKDLQKAINGMRAFGIRGCGVSMPHKSTVMQYLDKIDEAAKRIGAVNTIVNDDGVLSGYNTDYVGFKRALAESYAVCRKKAFIIGAGGAARAIIVALKDGGAAEIYLTNRDEQKGLDLAKEFSLHYYPFDKRAELSADILVNATPVGMAPNAEELIIDKQVLVHYHACMDVVVSPRKTGLILAAEAAGKIAIHGVKMALYQGLSQYELYTKLSAPIDILQKSMQKYLNN
ncbi:MAG: shikimate dehydrogenase [Candidatus Falkowbacteria bacterium]